MNNSTGTYVTFNFPDDIAVDNNGNVYVADEINNKIRKITSTGVVTTLAGSGSQGSVDGNGTAASFYRPLGVAVDSIGNVYVADTGNYKIRKIDPTGVVRTLPITSLGASLPKDVAVDSQNNIYFADHVWIRKITISK